MKYNLKQAMQVLSQTPAVIRLQLSGLDEEWIMSNEGPGTFSPYDVVGHLLHGEEADWQQRINRIIEFGTTKSFDVFDRFAMYEESKGKTLQDLLASFEAKRAENLHWLNALNLSQSDFEKEGMHPSLGKVTLEQLLATWVVHDLAHIAQINRVMAKQLKSAVGPWQEYIRVLHL